MLSHSITLENYGMFMYNKIVAHIMFSRQRPSRLSDWNEVYSHHYQTQRMEATNPQLATLVRFYSIPMWQSFKVGMVAEVLSLPQTGVKFPSRKFSNSFHHRHQAHWRQESDDRAKFNNMTHDSRDQGGLEWVGQN